MCKSCYNLLDSLKLQGDLNSMCSWSKDCNLKLGWVLATYTQPSPTLKDSEGWVLATYTQPSPTLKDSEGWVLVTCTWPSPRVKVSEGLYLLHVPSIILDRRIPRVGACNMYPA